MKNKIVAAVLAFHLGFFGVHKFYLGETIAGILYLLFFWTLIPGILGFFDFIFLLVMSEENFNLRYNAKYILAQRDSSSVLLESSQNKMSALLKLKELYDAGVITAEEYEQKRRKYLDEL